jgi:cellulose synthase/poly-beta-1,6-N-acetylglucosamine synthase-like glycosyltransferase
LDCCLAALASISYSRFELVVVDNAPEDSQARAVAARWNARYLVEPVQGLSRARNLGARACSSDIIAFTDDDAVVDPAWLTNLVVEFADPKVIAVTGRILPLKETQQRSSLTAHNLSGNGQNGAAKPVSSNGSPEFEIERRIIDFNHRHWFEMANFGGIGKGGNMAFRRSAFDVWPGFDERLGRGAPMYGGEEQRAFSSLIERGYRVAYNPNAIVYHPVFDAPEELRRRHLKGLAASTAFMTLLFFETPHRWKVLKYALQALFGKRRSWRPQKLPISGAIASAGGRFLACMAGPIHYLRARSGRKQS